MNVFNVTENSNPFNQFSQEKSTTVSGSNLLDMAEKHGFSVVDASWFFGVTIAAWYEYTSDPEQKIINRYVKKKSAINNKRSGILRELSEGPDEGLYRHLNQLDEQLEKLEKATIKLGRYPAKRALNSPVELPLALLYRVINAMPSLTEHVSLKTPDIDLFKSIIDRNKCHSEFSSYLGRDMNAGYRWLKGLNPPSPTVKRLMHALLLWFHAGEDDHVDERANWWIAVVENEHKLLGRELGKGVPKASSSGSEDEPTNPVPGL